MSDWIEWKGGECPVPADVSVQVRLADGQEGAAQAGSMRWDHVGWASDIAAYRVWSAPARGDCGRSPRHPYPPGPTLLDNPTRALLTGGKLSGNHYYRVRVAEPMSPELQAYTAECADIIEALGMTFNEGEAFKALWRLAAQRQGRGKPGNQAQYDADKVAHYGARVAAQIKRSAS